MAPEGASNMLGAEAPFILNTKVELANLLNTAIIVSSMPARFPALSKNGTVIIIFKLAIHNKLLLELLDGTKYGSPVATITEFANKIEGG